ncbi:glucose-6-phosphate isomerase family protein [Aestuariimicrobium sp. T2.26MG-19.2B]|uniref:glucose-6-phosphate isomerase family protein n=1 Tax=Aestuariimicrobium sp. T2.26MG-19.2B TaxID=3040679 RepID=UPI0024776A44|nr:glucose-6-phosphate isomerase family protein [Aestuariimicrobium sp. T2.26MG-19.2B]CAI9405810.1 Glucose-6-phosphate isomerase [Aestuariimicrobium sp. T2.26MG-19.2B]
MEYHPGFDIELTKDPLGFSHGADVMAPPLELRRLDDVRATLRDPEASGPDVLYAIAMDIGPAVDRPRQVDQNILFGACAYAGGTVGEEPVRSQGHVHAVSASCGTSTGELYEFWEGVGIVYMQEFVADDPGRCFAVRAEPGQKVLVPPGWAHCTVNADPSRPMAFGAWCVRDYGFDYADLRARRGLAWYPVLEGGELRWLPNEHYRHSSALVEKAPRDLAEFGVDGAEPIHRQWQQRPHDFDFIPRPRMDDPRWQSFVP